MLDLSDSLKSRQNCLVCWTVQAGTVCNSLNRNKRLNGDLEGRLKNKERGFYFWLPPASREQVRLLVLSRCTTGGIFMNQTMGTVKQLFQQKLSVFTVQALSAAVHSSNRAGFTITIKLEGIYLRTVSIKNLKCIEKLHKHDWVASFHTAVAKRRR